MLPHHILILFVVMIYIAAGSHIDHPPRGFHHYLEESIKYGDRNTMLTRLVKRSGHHDNVTKAGVTGILPPRRMGGAVIFRDDFNKLDLDQWKIEVSMYGGYNNEFQVYTNEPRNLFTKDGYLYLKPTLTTADPRFDETFLHEGTMNMKEIFGSCTNRWAQGCQREGKDGLLPPVMSSKVKSKPTIRYGVVEVRARICKGDWLWPAIWMKPRYHHYGRWPRSGEIDIMESRGNDGYFGVSKVSSTLHWGPDNKHNGFHDTTGHRLQHSWAEDFHVWRMEWTPEYIVMYVDDKPTLYVHPEDGFWEKGGFTGSNLWADGGKMAPFDQEFYLILNVAVGGTSGMFSNRKIKKPWSENSPKTATEDFWNDRQSWEKTWMGDDVAMLVDYVEMRHL